MISAGFSSGKPDNSTQSLGKTQAKQNFVVNNNYGLGQNERQTLSFVVVFVLGLYGRSFF